MSPESSTCFLFDRPFGADVSTVGTCRTRGTVGNGATDSAQNIDEIITDEIHSRRDWRMNKYLSLLNQLIQ